MAEKVKENLEESGNIAPEVEDKKSESQNKDKKASEPEKKKTTKGKKAKSKELTKIALLEEKLAQAKQENEALRDQHLRKIAEFENYKRRTEKEFLDHLQNATEGLIAELLPVIDDFERSIDHAKDSDNSESLLAGIELIYKKLYALLEKQGLKKLEAVGTEFDTDKHQALLQVDSEEHESGYVVEEHLKGYELNDKVIRHSQVLVAK